MIRVLALLALAAPAHAGSDLFEGALQPGLAAAYPEFSAGLVDCLSFNREGHDAPIGEDGTINGDGFAYTIFYPELTQPFPFMVAVSSSGGILNCSGQGAASLPIDDPLWPEVETLMEAAGMIEMDFPPPVRVYADCEAGRAVMFSDAGGTYLFAAMTGPNPASYCANFGPKG
ncbi:MAG: hypothetical protein AAFO93_01970 [Pseudomonadota bacterium]